MTMESNLLEQLGITPAQVSATAMFRDVSLADVEDALSDCPVVRVEQGTVIIRAGQQLERMYVIIKGEVDVCLGSLAAAPVARLAGGEIFGEFSVIDRQPASAYVRAASPCTLLGITREALWNLFAVSPEVANNLLTILVSRVRDSNETIRTLQRGLGSAAPSLISDRDTMADDPSASALP